MGIGQVSELRQRRNFSRELIYMRFVFNVSIFCGLHTLAYADDSRTLDLPRQDDRLVSYVLETHFHVHFHGKGVKVDMTVALLHDFQTDGQVTLMPSRTGHSMSGFLQRWRRLVLRNFS